jgi:hypothetical protein
MHPSFGIEFTCPSTKWEDVIKGPSQAAVLAHTHKVLHYRSLFTPDAAGRIGAVEERNVVEQVHTSVVGSTERVAA